MNTYDEYTMQDTRVSRAVSVTCPPTRESPTLPHHDHVNSSSSQSRSYKYINIHVDISRTPIRSHSRILALICHSPRISLLGSSRTSLSLSLSRWLIASLPAPVRTEQNAESLSSSFLPFLSSNRMPFPFSSLLASNRHLAHLPFLS